jgi:hypothetical protein
MGYDTTTETRTIERYIQEIQLHRDSAACTVFEGLGELSSEVNAAGRRFHKPESNVRYDFTVADMIAAGLTPQAILALDDQMRAMAETMVTWAKAKAEAAKKAESVTPTP